jgi:hypothetical protein
MYFINNISHHGDTEGKKERRRVKGEGGKEFRNPNLPSPLSLHSSFFTFLRVSVVSFFR